MGDEYEEADMAVEHDPYMQRMKKLYDDASRWAAMIRNQPANQVARDNFQQVMNQSQPSTDEESVIYQIIRGMYHTSNHGYMGIVNATNGGKYIFFTDSLKILIHFRVSEYIFMTFDSGEATYIVRPRDDRGLNFSSSDYGHRADYDQPRRGYADRGGRGGRGGHFERGERGGHFERNERGRGGRGGHFERSERSERGGYSDRGRRGGYSDRPREEHDRHYAPRAEPIADIGKLVRDTIQQELAHITEETRKANRKAKYIPKSIKRAEEAAAAAATGEKPAAAEVRPEPKEVKEPKVKESKEKEESEVTVIPKTKKKQPAKEAAEDRKEAEQAKPSTPKKVVEEVPAPVPTPSSEKTEPPAAAIAPVSVLPKKKGKAAAKGAAKASAKPNIPVSKSWADDVENGEEMKFD